MIHRLIRVGRMALVRAAGSAARLGVEKFVVVPLMLPLLGAKQLGVVLLALAWCRMLLPFPFAATNNAVLRTHAVAASRREWPGLYRAGLGAGAFGGALVGALGLAVYLFRHGAVGVTDDLPGLFALLCVGLATFAVGLRSSLTTDLSVRLKFGTISALETFEGLLLLLSIPLARAYGAEGLLAGLLVAAAGGLAATAWINRGILGTSSPRRTRWLPVLLRTSLAFSAISAIAHVLFQVARVTVGWFEGAEAVSVFFAAEACVLLLTTPMHYVNGVLFNILAGKRDPEEVGRNAMVQHMVAVIAAAAVFYVVALRVSPIVLGLLFASVAEPARPVLEILILGGAFQLLHVSTTAFFYRFARLRTVLALSLASLTVFVLAVVALTAKHGLTGAATGVTVGHGFMGLLWFTTYGVVFVFRAGRGKSGRTS